MPLNIRGKRARQRERAMQVRLMAAYERPLELSLFQEFSRIGHRAAELYAAGLGEASALDVTWGLQETGQRMLVQSLRSTGLVFGSRLLDAFGKNGKSLLETKTAQNTFMQTLDEWLATYAAEQIARVAETTRRHIRRIITASNREGLSIAQTATNIRNGLSGRVSRRRAHTIARTETHHAANRGTMAAADATGLKLYKEWVSAEDSRTREGHIHADGQLREKGDAFTIGGAAMKHPGDPAGGARNTINCRCVMTFNTSAPIDELE